MRSGQLAEAAGVNPQTLRYYERRGLLAEPERSLGGHRLYPPQAVTTLRAIKAAQRLGFSLTEVAELLAAGRPHRGGRFGVGLRRHAQDKLAEVEARIADLNTLRCALSEAVEAGCDDLLACGTSPSCPLPFAEVTEERDP
ncbi:MerR family transcriptional regulator [Actinopolyspora mortivallis]|uniref:MerR family transcriptional regulator n=1 Tax=Actinopolyspora mortivallis TaxID=33906 RepID=UPI0004796688